MPEDKKELKSFNVPKGRRGEELAKAFLTKKGHEILDSHWQKRVGELDVIARDPKTDEIIFVEVKTRTSREFGYPEERVKPDKLTKLTKTAQLWLIENKHPNNHPWRLDIISIIISNQYNKAEITHYKNVGIENF